MFISQLLETHLVLTDAIEVIKTIGYTPDDYRRVVALVTDKKANMAEIQAARDPRLKRFSDKQLMIRRTKLINRIMTIDGSDDQEFQYEIRQINIEIEIRGVLRG